MLADRRPHVVIHAPDDVDGAPIARLWNAALRAAVAEATTLPGSAACNGYPIDIDELPAWPVERGRQLELFD